MIYCTLSSDIAMTWSVLQGHFRNWTCLCRPFVAPQVLLTQLMILNTWLRCQHLINTVFDGRQQLHNNCIMYNQLHNSCYSGYFYWLSPSIAIQINLRWCRSVCTDGLTATAIELLVTAPPCLSVCLSVRWHIRIHHMSEFHQTFCTCYQSCDNGSILIWRHCNKLCSSDFVDIVMISYNGASGTKSKTTYMFSPVRQARTPEIKSVVFDCTLLCLLSAMKTYIKLYT